MILLPHRPALVVAEVLGALTSLEIRLENQAGTR
jgi:hypothetical protein